MVMAPELCLPWESSLEEDRRFRKILLTGFAAFLLLAIAIPLLPLQELSREEIEEVPPHLARIILEKKVLPKPEPVAVKPIPKPRPIAKKEPDKPRPVESPQAKPEVKPRPVDTIAEARKAAAVSGVLAFQDDLQAMRDTVDVNALDQTQTSRGEASATRVERSVITSGVRTNSGGIQTAALSKDTGGPALSGRETTAVQSSIAGNSAKKAPHSRSAELGGRSDESIRRVMDKNKGAIFAIYNRALRKDPLLEGKLVFEMVIDASGTVAQLKLLGSELTDEDLTRKILSRIRLIDFGQEQAITTRVNYSFDFLPYS